jgi:hypothetical protein
VKIPGHVIRRVYAACLSGAAFNHARIVFEHGIWWDYGGVHRFLATFWTSLTFLDTLAVVLLLTWPRAGVAATVLIIASDVVINACAGIIYRFDLPAFAAQFAFLVFVLATAKHAWQGVKLAPHSQGKLSKT